MKKNMGSLDKALRVIVAIVIGILVYNHTLTGPLATALSVLAGIFLATSILSFCPLYVPFGLKTSGQCCGKTNCCDKK